MGHNQAKTPTSICQAIDLASESSLSLFLVKFYSNRYLIDFDKMAVMIGAFWQGGCDLCLEFYPTSIKCKIRIVSNPHPFSGIGEFGGGTAAFSL